jgi:hypothetical protein
MLYNTVDMESGGPSDADTAAILEGTQLCCTRQLRDLLHCLGGVTVLLPLFAQLGLQRRPKLPTRHKASAASPFCRCITAYMCS